MFLISQSSTSHDMRLMNRCSGRLSMNQLSTNLTTTVTTTSTMFPTFITSSPLSSSSSSTSLRRLLCKPPRIFLIPASLKQHQHFSKIPSACSSSTSAPLPTTAEKEISFGKKMTSNEIREAFLSFYESKSHGRLPSASLIPSDPTILLNIAGMVPFKRIFLGMQPIPENPRITTSQKCVRTNDIENVGITKRHHTFFEMLGNFSFGNYFKKQAIQYAWQLLTEIYQIPSKRLAISVYKDDDESYKIWTDVIGMPEHRIQKLGEDDNFWVSGATGPCGPCSEIYFDFMPLCKDEINLEDDRFIELYNLVFMQYSRNEDGSLIPLENQNIDTGMGLERMAQVLQQVPTNYETDLIMPIMNSVAQLSPLIKSGKYENSNDKMKLSLKVIGDHLRAVAHLVGDGVRPSNVSRGYIVRRLIRRIVRHGRLLGIDGHFSYKVLPCVGNLAMEGGFNNINETLDDIIDVVKKEEIRFLQTLVIGEERLEQLLEDSNEKFIKGEIAFELYDTFGFPLELTQEIGNEMGFTVDVIGFEKCMNEQRDRARSARDNVSFAEVYKSNDSSNVINEVVEQAGNTLFKGYEENFITNATVRGLVSNGSQTDIVNEGDNDVIVILDKSPFYAEGGGQRGDIGIIESSNGKLQVKDTRKITSSSSSDTYIHICNVVQGEIHINDTASASVNKSIRSQIEAHHTATHLLQSALKMVLKNGNNITQAGSLVDSNRLRFDFNYNQSLNSKELEKIESTINEWISNEYNANISYMGLGEAKEKGAVAMFGEKYDTNNVRVIDIPGVSMELCGGTHVKNTKDIGLFKIINESGPSAGIRRIEAICGLAIMPYLNQRDKTVKELSKTLKSKPEEIVNRVNALQEEVRNVNKELERIKGSVAISKALGTAKENKEFIKDDWVFVVAEIGNDDNDNKEGMSGDSLRVATEKVGEFIGEYGVVLLASKKENEGKISFASFVGKKVLKEYDIKAGKLVGEIAKICGGGGGGRPNFAQAGGRDISKLDEALQHAKSIIRSSLTK